MLGTMKRPACVLCLLLWGVAPASAETYRSVPLDALIFEGPKERLATELEQEISTNSFQRLDVRMEEQAYLHGIEDPGGSIVQGDARLIFKGAAKLPLKGVVDLAADYGATELRSVGFTILEGTTVVAEEKEFLAARSEWARERARNRVAGTPWFRHLTGHRDEAAEGAIEPAAVLSTLDIFSGGRAIADNLALNRDLILARGEGEEMVRLDTIEGVTVKPIDWSKRLPAGEVVVDPLAAFLPEDQHALFAPSLPTLLALLERLDQEAGPWFTTILGSQPHHGLLTRYRRQLGLDVTDVAARLLPVRTVAVTGGDPYFATGTDVALLMETDKPEALLKALELAVRAQTGTKPQRHSMQGVERLSFVLPEKGISSHLCQIGQVVVVTNSQAQVRRIQEVVEGRTAALGTGDEFRFFRHRYPAQGESAYLFLSDATIRRWCGPVTRIGASRRNRALGALNELTCRGILPCAQEQDYSPLLGRVALLDGRAISEHFGSAEFLTPISELGLTEVSSLEKEAYLQWKGGYESGWGQFFDPIALQLRLGDDSLDMDLTVLPLNVNSEVMGLMGICGNSALTPRSRMRPEGSVLRLACAVDSSSRFFEQFETQLVSLLPDLKIKPLSWLGDSVSMDLMDSLFWEGLGNMSFEENLAQLPVVWRFEVKSKMKLSLFLTACRAMIQTSAPDALEWINRKHGKQSYVIVGQREAEEFQKPIRVGYAIAGNALLLSLDERLLRRSIDFELQEWPAAQMAKLPPGRSMLLDVDPTALAVADDLFQSGDSEASRAARASWSAIPVLNEWRRRQPGQDPVATHRQLFGVDLHCPGGRGYQWNAAHLTMESVAYGHMGAPRAPEAAPGLGRYSRLTSAIDFEDDGLRLRLHLGPAVELPALPDPEPGALLGTAEKLNAYRVGRVLSYESTGPQGEETWGFEVAGIEETPRGRVVTTREPWAFGGEQGVWEGRYLVDRDGVWTLGGKDEFSSMHHSQPSLHLPTELRQGALHRSESKGRSTFDDNGLEEVEISQGRSEIRVLGTETLETAAGTFPDCVLIERHTEDLTDSYFDSSLVKEWYHPGTGLVQSLYADGTLSKLVRIEDKKK